MLMNRDRANNIMNEYGLDALIASTVENVNYASDFSHRFLEVWKTTQVYAVLPNATKAAPALIIPFTTAAVLAETPSWITDVRVYGTFPISLPPHKEMSGVDAEVKRVLEEAKNTEYKDAIDALVAVLQERGLWDCKLGVDEGAITPAVWEKIRTKLPRAEILPAYDIFRKIRMVKTPTEIERLQKSAQIAEGAIVHSASMIREGVTEQELFNAYLGYVGDAGALPGSFLVSIGTRTGAFLPVSGKYQLRKGDLIKYDVGCVKDGYWSDVARTLVLGTPSQKQREYFEAIHDAHLESMEAVRAGVKTSRVFQKAVNAVRRCGITHYERPHCGHGIGLEFYDLPMLRPPLSPADIDTILEENTVICVENPYYEVGFGGLSVEDTLVVTKTGYRSLTSLRRDLWII